MTKGVLPILQKMCFISPIPHKPIFPFNMASGRNGLTKLWFNAQIGVHVDSNSTLQYRKSLDAAA